MNPSSTTQTSTQQAPSWQQPYQAYGQNQALAQYQNPSSLVAPFAPQQEQAISNITGMANNGTPVANSANNYATGVLNNGPTQNPYLDNTFNMAAQQTQGQLASQFAGSGRNVDASQGQRSQQLNDLATQIYGGAYNTGIQQQEQALAAAPGLDQNQYAAQQQLYNAGGQVQNLSQQYIQAPQNSLNQYLQRTGVNMGSTSTTPLYYNQAAGALGGALTGSQIGSALGGSNNSYAPWLGALAGGLLGG